MFLQVSVIHSVHRGGGGLPQCMLGYPPPRSDPLGPGRHPPDQADPPRPGSPPHLDQTPPWTRQTPPGSDTPRKQTPAYGLRAAGTHPTGMHSCFECNIISNVFNPFGTLPQTFGPSLRWHVLFILKVTSHQHRIRTNEVNQFYIWTWNWLRNTARKGLMGKYVILAQRLALVFALNLVSILRCLQHTKAKVGGDIG